MKEPDDKQHPYWRMGFTTIHCPMCNKVFHTPPNLMPASVISCHFLDEDASPPQDFLDACPPEIMEGKFLCSAACAAAWFEYVQKNWPTGAWTICDARPRSP